MPVIRSAAIRADEEALRNRPSAQPALSVPGIAPPAPKVDPFLAEAAKAEALLRPLDEIAVLQLASTPQQVNEVAVEAALQQLIVENPDLTREDIAALRATLMGGAR